MSRRGVSLEVDSQTLAEGADGLLSEGMRAIGQIERCSTD